MKQTVNKRASIFLTSLTCFFTILLLYHINLQLYQAKLENLLTMEEGLKAESLALLAISFQDAQTDKRREEKDNVQQLLEEESMRIDKLKENIRDLEKEKNNKEDQFEEAQFEKENKIEALNEELQELEMEFAYFSTIAYDRDIVDEEDKSSPIDTEEKSDWLASHDDLVQSIEHERKEVQALEEQWKQEKLASEKDISQVKKDLKEARSKKAELKKMLSQLDKLNKEAVMYRFNLGEVELRQEEKAKHCRVILYKNDETYQFSY